MMKALLAMILLTGCSSAFAITPQQLQNQQNVINYCRDSANLAAEITAWSQVGIPSGVIQTAMIKAHPDRTELITATIQMVVGAGQYRDVRGIATQVGNNVYEGCIEQAQEDGIIKGLQ